MFLIFDCDNTLGIWKKEIDDGLTLFYLLGQPEIDLLGITTTFGNGTIDQVYDQTQALIRRLGRPEIPLARGAGQRGETESPAAELLVQAANQHPGELVILATGPLSNLRAAHEIDGNFFAKIKQIACMGGYLEPVQMGRRDVSELNLSADPEAAHLVLNARCPVTLMSAQICLQAPFYWKDLRKISFWSLQTRWTVARWLILHAAFCGLNHFYLWDLLPALSLSYPELFSGPQVRINSTVQDLETGDLVPGGTVQDGQVFLPDRIVNYPRFFQLLIDSWRNVEI